MEVGTQHSWSSILTVELLEVFAVEVFAVKVFAVKVFALEKAVQLPATTESLTGFHLSLYDISGPSGSLDTKT